MKTPHPPITVEEADAWSKQLDAMADRLSAVGNVALHNALQALNEEVYLTYIEPEE